MSIGSALKSTNKRDNPSLADTLNDGWVRYGSTGVAVYVSGTSFKITGIDVTADFTRGRRLRIYHVTTDAYKYVTVVSSSFSTDTTVTVSGNTLLNEVYSSIWMDISPVGYANELPAGGALTAGDILYVGSDGMITRLAKPTVPGILENDATGVPQWITTGWLPMGVTLTYSSVDDPTGVVTSSVDVSSILSVGTRLRFVNGGNTIYGIITAISGTTITFLHEIDPSDSLALTLMANSAITVPVFSYHKAPYGFPVDKRKWTVAYVGTSTSSQAAPDAATWYNLGSGTLSMPIGSWDATYNAGAYIAAAGASYTTQATLSTANNSESDSGMTAKALIYAPAGGNGCVFTRSKLVVVASKTAQYLNWRVSTPTPTSINLISNQYITFVCSYL